MYSNKKKVEINRNITPVGRPEDTDTGQERTDNTML